MQPYALQNRFVGITAGLFLLAGSALVQGDVEDRIKKSFDVAPGGRLIIDVDRGSIEVKTTSDNVVGVEIIRQVDGWNRTKAEETLRNHQVDVSQDGNDVHIHSELKGGVRRFWNTRGRQLRVRYIISTPTKFNVDLKTAGGSISTTDLAGNVRARTSGGSLHFGQIGGPLLGRTSGGSISVAGCKQNVDVETSGGNLKIGDVEGPVVAKTSGGSITINRAKGHVLASTSGGSIDVKEVGGKIEASTSGGSVSARLSGQPQGDCRLKTSGGNIDVALAEKIAIDLDASTSGGRVVTDIPLTVQGEVKKTALRSRMNGGGPALVLHTSGGNVRIRKL